MNFTRSIAPTLAVSVIAICAGCRSTPNIKFAYDAGAPPAPTQACHVSLRLTREFSEYQHVTKPVFMVHSGVAVSFGPALQKYAAYVAQSQFGEVEMLGSNPPSSDSKLLIVPSVTSSDLAPATDALSPTAAALGVQWVFQDPKTGQTLLTIPVQCEYMDPSGFWRSPSKAAVGLMMKLTTTTNDRLSASKDLRRLTGHE